MKFFEKLLRIIAAILFRSFFFVPFGNRVHRFEIPNIMSSSTSQKSNNNEIKDKCNSSGRPSGPFQTYFRPETRGKNVLKTHKSHQLFYNNLLI